ncbi:MAG TPA: hypothetical protein VGF19_14510 [Candidatus Acidoferrum sp.]
MATRDNFAGKAVWLSAMFAMIFSGVADAGIRRSPLRVPTARAFEGYVERTDERNRVGTDSGNFLWVDELDQKQRAEAFEKLRNGGVLIRRAGADNGENRSVPGGLIHDWKGIIFIPGVKLDDVVKMLQDYDHQAVYYAPDVEQSRVEARDGNHFRVYLRFRRQKVVTVVLNTEHDVNYYRDSATREHSRSSAVKIAQVENPGSGQEKEKTPGEDDGYLWRMETWWRMEERDGGVYVQNEVVTLTRDIPIGLAWMIEPFITNIPKETLEFTLQATRNAVLKTKSR